MIYCRSGPCPRKAALVAGMARSYKKIAELQSEQIYDNHSICRVSCLNPTYDRLS
jgi:hypothetical protein